MTKKAKSTKPATAELFLAEVDVDPKREELDGFGFFYVQVMTASERGAAYETECLTQRRVNLISIGIVDEKGIPLFDQTQAAAMCAKRSNTAERLVSLVMKHNSANRDPDPAAKN